MITLTIDEAASRFDQIIRLIGDGEEVVVLDHEQPVARIIRCEGQGGTRPKVGAITSAPVRYASNCFGPLSDEELKEWGL